MQRRSATMLLFAAVVLTACAAVVAWAWFVDEPGPNGDPRRGPETSIPPSAVRGATEPDAPPRPDVRVRVEVRAGEVFVPPSSVRVIAVAVHDGSELATHPIAGVGAGFGDADARPGLALVAIDIGGGSRVLRQVDVPAGEVARPAVGTRVVMRGVVRDSQQRPIAGARVWLGESDGAGVQRDVACGDDGRFELDVPAGAGVPFVVRAHGFASTWRPVVVSSTPTELAAVLAPAATLRVQVAGSSDGIDTARLFVVPADGDSALTQYPFFLQALTDGLPLTATGGAVLLDLPASGVVSLLVRHPRAPLGTGVDMKLREGDLSTTVPVTVAAASMRGTIVDDAGAPVAGAGVWLRPGGSSIGGKASLRLLPPHLDARGCLAATTSAAGAFELGAVAGTGTLLSVRAPGHAGRDVPVADVAGAPIVLPAWRGDEIAFRLAPPGAAMPWIAECDLAGGIRAELTQDEPWVVSLPHAGRFEFVVTTWCGEQLVGTKTLADVVVTGTVAIEPARRN